MSVIESPWGAIEFLPKGNGAEFVLSSTYKADDNKPQYIDAVSGEVLTVGENRRIVKRLAAYFADNYGVKKDDVVLVFGYNSISTPAIHFATLCLAGIVSPANVMYNPEELAHQAAMVKPKIAICADDRLDVATEGLKLAKTTTKVLKMSEIHQVIRSLLNDSNAREQEPVQVDGATQHAYYCFSSGTSGLPKGVVSTHQNIAANVIQQLQTKAPVTLGDNIGGAVLPMSHIYGLNMFIWLYSYRKNTLVVLPKFDFPLLLQSIVKYKISHLALVPPIILLFAKHPLLEKFPDVKKTLLHINSGAAPISQSTIAQAENRLGSAKVGQGYGLTETSPVTHVNSYDIDAYDSNGIGWLVPGTEARLVDPETNKDVKNGERGELWLKGPQVFKSYLNNEAATADCFCPERIWFKTGDVAVRKENGQFYIVDRIKELIKSKGHQVAPAELEALLLTHPQVVDAAVVGVSDQDGVTELPRAYVVLAPETKGVDVVKWFNSKVAKHKRLWGGAVVVEAVPKSASGKILRRFLRDKKEDPTNVVGIELAKL